MFVKDFNERQLTRLYSHGNTQNIIYNYFSCNSFAVCYVHVSWTNHGILNFLCYRNNTIVSFYRFSIMGKTDPNTVTRIGGCSFELEICYLPSVGFPSRASDSTPTKSILKNGTIKTSTPKTEVGIERTKSGDFVVSRAACVGIRRKRLKGDSWCYKKVCEQVLALTTTELKRPVESSV